MPDIEWQKLKSEQEEATRQNLAAVPCQTLLAIENEFSQTNAYRKQA